MAEHLLYRMTAENLGGILLLAFKTKHYKLAIRSLIDKARRNMWNEALKILSDAQREEVVKYIKDKRQFGQSEESWKLRVKALDTICSDWRASLNIDPDMFATINGKEYNKVLCAPAHEFSPDEIKAAIATMNSDLQDFYNEVLTPVGTVL